MTELTMTRMRKCGRCGTYGHNKRTCKFSDKEIKDLKERRERGSAMIKERRERARAEVTGALVRGLNALAEIAGGDDHFWLEGDGQGGLYLENTMGIPNNHLDFDGPEAVAVVVAEIAKKLGDNEDN
tara:strand:- start:296 stop:676 length:381 start_codon:yes stop_codon:yes gene_type:complete